MRARLLFLAFVMVFFTTNVALQIFGRVYAAEFHVTNATGLQNALTTAQNNGQDDTIYLAAGVYSAVENGKGFVYDSTNGDNRKLTIWGENGTTAEEVILDGGNAFVPVLSLVDENPDHLNSAFTVQGITIKNGKMQEWDQNGGGLCVSSKGDVTVKSCIIIANTGDDGGGVAIWSDYGWVTFINNIVTNNVAMDDGGGVDIGAETIILKRNIIEKNRAAEDGGGLRIGISSITGNITCKNNIIAENTGRHGGGIQFLAGSIDFINNTVTKNNGQMGGGVYLVGETSGSTAHFYNNIIWGNTAGEGADIYNKPTEPIGFVRAYNNDYQFISGDAFEETRANIDADPLFVNPAAHDYHLSANSPCIDKGTADAPELPDTDFEGNPRIVGSAPDMGADEFIRAIKSMPWLHLLLGE